jgi:hypothetical protein
LGDSEELPAGGVVEVSGVGLEVRATMKRKSRANPQVCCGLSPTLLPSVTQYERIFL